MRTPTTAELAYVAGFFDGEGYVTIGPQSRDQQHYYMRAGITNTCRRPLELCQEIWGGSVVESRDRGSRLLAYRWYLHGAKAFKFLSDIEPYLLVKLEQVSIAAKFESLKRGYGSRYLPFEKEGHRIYAEQLKDANRNPQWSRLAPDRED